MVGYTNKQTNRDYNTIYKYIDADDISIIYSCNLNHVLQMLNIIVHE